MIYPPASNTRWLEADPWRRDQQYRLQAPRHRAGVLILMLLAAPAHQASVLRTDSSSSIEFQQLAVLRSPRLIQGPNPAAWLGTRLHLWLFIESLRN